MKKKIAMAFASLGLCASLMMFNANEANADPCVVDSKHGEEGTWTEDSCYGSSGSCKANLCLEGD